MHIFFNRLFVVAKQFLYALFVCFALPPHSVLAMPGMPGMENLSPEEMQQLEQELQAAAQQIDAYVSSLSPEEQAEFQRAVQEVEQMMNNMSQEELEQFFEQIIAAEMEQQQLQQGLPPVQPQQAPMTLEHKPAPVVSKVPLTSAEEKALTLLTSLLDSTDKFLLKTDNIPDMKGRFKRWAENNKITGVSSTTSWEQQKNAINDLRQHVSDLKKTDLKTGKYLFIEAFNKNSALYSQLEQLNKQLETNEPRIIVSTFGIEKLSNEAKNALQTCLNAFGSSLESTKTDIKKLFDEIGPELVKIKEEEKKVTEKAQTEAAKGRQVVPGRTAGSVERGGYYGGGRGDYDEYGGYPYGRDHGYGDYGRPREGAEAGKEKGKPKGGGKGGGKGKEKEEEGDKDKDKGKGKGEKGKEAKVEGPKQPKEIVTCPADGGEQLNGQYELIASNYRYIDDLFKESIDADVFNIKKLLKEANPNPQFALYVFPALERRLKRLNELIETYTKEVAKIKDADKAKEKEKQVAALNKLTELHEKQANLKTFAEQLEKVMEAISTTEDADIEERDTFIRDMSPAARYAYFKDELKLSKEDKDDPENKLKPVGEETKKQLPATSLVSLSNISSEIEKLNKAMPKKKAEKEKTEEEKETPQKRMDEAVTPKQETPKTQKAPQAEQA
jgi:hypothetical protein